MQTVKEMMTTSPRTCQKSDLVKEVVATMKKMDCGAIPVVDKEGHVVNIITDRDIALCMEHPGRNLEQLRVQDCVGEKRTVVSVMLEDDIHRAIDLMEEYQVRRLVVIDQARRCIGMLAQADIARKDRDSKEVGELVRELSR